MIIFDMSQVLISNIAAKYRNNPDEINEDMIRHMTIQYILSYVKKFREKYGDEIVIAADSKTYWRRTAFPYYKASRAKARAKSKFDWNVIYGSIDTMKKELYGIIPYKVIEVSGAEADDIIAVLSKRNSLSGIRTLIISSDMDFVQLQTYPGVEQFSPKNGAFISAEEPEAFLREHIIEGDKDDGIPNILTEDAVYVTEGARSKRMMGTTLKEWVSHDDPMVFCTTPELNRNYARNRMLIDFNYIPEDIVNSIIEKYENCEVGNRKKLMNYFFDKGLVNLVQNLGDF